MSSKRPGDGTGISWTHVPGYKGETWNPTTGCTRVSPGCNNCYAFTLHDNRYAKNLDRAREALQQYPALLREWVAERVRRSMPTNDGPELIAYVREHAAQVPLPWPKQYDRPFSTVQMLDDDRLTKPTRERVPRAYFVDSMADLFHEDVTDEFLDRVYDQMEKNPRHIFMVLTKRPERMADYVAARYRRVDQFDGISTVTAEPPSNIWHGTSVEDQERADERVFHLMQVPGAVRFLSMEPLLGPVMLGAAGPTWLYDRVSRNKINWVIVGGESGQRFRPMSLQWALDIQRQCRLAGTAFFFKQGSAFRNGQPSGEMSLDTAKAFPLAG